MTRLISDSLLILDTCLAVLAKSEKLVNSQFQLVDFLKPWCDVAKYTDNILFYLQKNSLLPLGFNVSLNLLSKTQKKITLKAFRTFIKLKYMNDPKVAEKAHLTTLRDEWLIAYRKSILETKVQIKKAVEAEKKKIKKENKA